MRCFFVLVVLPLSYVDKQSIVVGFFLVFFRYSIFDLISV